MALKKIIITLETLFAFAVTPAWSQMWERMFADEYRLDTTDTRTLKADIDVSAYFHDNEYTSEMSEGYTLPGARVIPKVTYQPIDNIKVELGFSAMLYNGANRYPNYAYHDIATWKGDQYTSGCHVLPWVRLQAQLKNLNIVLGNIYGGSNHHFSDVIYNPEVNLSQDPEMGLQLLLDLPHLEMDTWLNWQSYIFRMSTHQEAFTVGSRWNVIFGKKDNPLNFYMPIELLIQHRGGEQDATSMGVQTICNGALGFGARYSPVTTSVLTNAGGEVNILGCLQQAGHLWPFKNGFACHAQGFVRLWDALCLKAGYFVSPRQFANLYGNQYFSTLRQKTNTNCEGLHTIYLKASWDKTWNKQYTIGAQIEAYQSWIKQTTRNELNFNFGIYARITPKFKIKRF